MPAPSPIVRRVTALALLLALAIGGCDPGPDPSVAALRPGDSLLELLDQARLEAYPETNLPAAVAALVAEQVPECGWSLPAARWRRFGEVPRDDVPHWLRQRGVPLYTWTAALDFYVPDAEAGAALRFVQDGRALRRPEDGAGPGGDLMIAWHHDMQVAFAVSPERPQGVAVVRQRPARELFGALERRLFAPQGELPRPTSLRHRLAVELDEHEGLLLPAPARLSLPARRLLGDQLRFGLVLVPQAFREYAGAVQRVRNPSDGVVCALEVDRGAGFERLWERLLSVDEGLQEVAVDLADLQGEVVALRLVSEPGPRGRNAGDYLVLTAPRLAGPPARAPSRPHVVLIDIDTLRADALGAGLDPGGPSVTPRLDAWAASQALVFEDAQAVASWTLPSTASLMTGLAVHQHGLRHHDVALPEQAVSLAQRLSAVGYQARAWTEGGYVHASFGFGAGFERYASVAQRQLDWQAPLDWLDQRRSERPVFLFVHSYLVHAPYPHEPAVEVGRDYDGPLAGQDIDYDNVIHPVERREMLLDAADRAYLRRQYLAGVARMDTRVGDLLDGLAQRFGDEPWLAVLTSDHGELLGEHDLIDHHITLFDEVLAVPLLIRLPEGRPGRRDQPASQLDVVPTVLDALGLPVPADLPGRSLLAPARPDVVRVAQHGAGSHSLTLGATKLVRGATHPFEERDVAPRLFDRRSDPQEQVDLAAVRPDDVQRLSERLDDWLQRWRPVGEARASRVGGATQAALQALGYLGGDDGAAGDGQR